MFGFIPRHWTKMFLFPVILACFLPSLEGEYKRYVRDYLVWGVCCRSTGIHR